MAIIIQAFITGIVGTLVMTLFMNIASVVTGYNFRVPSILGSMLTMRTNPSGASSRSFGVMLTGNLAHYLIGVLFTFVYLEVMYFNGLHNTFRNAIIFGIIAGLVAVAFWYSFLKLHPLAPAVRLNLYLIFIFIAHIIFAVSFCGTLRLLEHYKLLTF